MVRSITGRKCHVSLQSQSLLCPADMEGTLFPAPSVSLRLHGDVTLLLLLPMPGFSERGTHGAQRTSGRQGVRREKTGVAKSRRAEERADESYKV